MLEDEYRDNPTNTWNLWYLLYHYKNSNQIDKYIPAACLFIDHHKRDDDWYKKITTQLTDIYRNAPINIEQKEQIYSSIKNIL
jgi:hypothetical protein